MRRCLLPVLAAVALLGACSDEEPPDWLVERAASTTTTTTAVTPTAPTTSVPDEPGQEVAAIDLEPGMCIEDAESFTSRQVNEITETTAVACRLPHGAEAYAREELAGGADAPFPGVGPLRRQAQAACRDQFEPFVGVPWTRSELEIAALWPSPDSWPTGDRLVVCVVFRLDGQPLTGSARGSGI